ncbi:hypothetical protein C8R45DRAFT_1096445 [Mycena sanguinolenta]|nr:hypothetical protein C8R45DRAFT_1096445 [Mycena sanguinolenta]
MFSLRFNPLFFVASAAISTSAIAVSSAVTTASAALPTLPGACAPEWAQCTSQNLNWIGPACCDGSVCTVLNAFWSQCLVPVPDSQ